MLNVLSNFKSRKGYLHSSLEWY